MAPEETTGLTEEEAAKDEKASRKLLQPRKLNYVMVTHLGSSPLTRTRRVSRGAGRQLRFTLSNGTQIREKGARYTELTFKTVLDNFNKLLKGVSDGVIGICRPDNLEMISVEQFLDLGKRLAEDFDKDLKIDKTVLESLDADQADKKVWEESEKSEAKDSDITKPSLEPSVIAAEERKKLDEPVAEGSEAKSEEPQAEETEADGVPSETKTTKKRPVKKGRR